MRRHRQTGIRAHGPRRNRRHGTKPHRTKRQRTMTTSIRERLDAMRAFYAEGHTRNPHSAKIPAQTAGGRKGTRARDSGSPVRRPAQIGGRVVYQRDGHCAGRNTRPTAASGAPGPQPAGAYPALPLPLREPHHSGTAGGGACHGAVNYPFQLALDPLVGALAAGNCVALKPSTTSARTCRLIGNILGEVFPPDYVSVFDGDHAQTAELLEYRFDHIFFTGGAASDAR